MSKIYFDTLLDKYLTGTCTADEKKLVEHWYSLLDNTEFVSPKEIGIIKGEIWAKVKETIQPVPITKAVPFWQKPIFRYAVAASFLVFLSINGYLFIRKQFVTEPKLAIFDKNIVKQQNTSDKIISLTLEDGSQIDLYPQAELSYPKQFSADKREVTLRGEAFFKITKNPAKPFFVYANQTITKVLGTSFTIKAIDQEKMVTVTVKTGKVSVYNAIHNSNKNIENIDPETKGVVVTPNQVVVIDLNKEDIQKKVVEKPTILIPLTNTEDFIFTDSPVSKIFEAMEKTYGIDIVYDEELLKNCTLTTTLTDVPMFNKLKIICSAIGATYKEIDAHIVISAKGC